MLKYGWLSPEGRFMFCAFGGHYDTAKEIVREKYPEEYKRVETGYSHDGETPYMILFSKGYSRIVDDSIEFASNSAKDAILEFVKQYYMNEIITIFRRSLSGRLDKEMFSGRGNELIEKGLFENKMFHENNSNDLTNLHAAFASPEGEIITYHQDHEDTAKQIIWSKYSNISKDKLDIIHNDLQLAIDFLLDKGWVRIEVETGPEKVLTYQKNIAKHTVVELVTKYFMNRQIIIFGPYEREIFRGIGKDFTNKGLFENIKLKKIIEQFSTEGISAWIDPYGELISVPFEEHASVGFKIIEKKYPEDMEKYEVEANSSYPSDNWIFTILLRRGYVLVEQFMITFFTKNAKDSVIEFVMKHYMNQKIYVYKSDFSEDSDDDDGGIVFKGIGKDFINQGLFESKNIKLMSILKGITDKKGITEKNVDSKELKMGIKVEMEHTINKELAKKIALDHLAENPKYYTRLKKIEKH
jgi:hypothetical protein